jgi:multisubunit Na+/H+ antiporter MnhB subunit
MSIVHTHAGDDSDGKIWGIEGMNLLFMLAGLLISIGLALLLARHQAPTLSFGAGAGPFALVTLYVFAFRQGKPKAFDTDWLETLAAGSGWMPPVRQSHNPLFSHASTQRLVH